MFTKFQIFVLTTIYVSTVIMFFSIYSYYQEYGEIFFSFRYLYKQLTTPASIYTIICIVALLFMYLQWRFYRKKMDNRDNCQIQFVDIEKIAHNWLKAEDVVRQNKEDSEIELKLTTVDATYEDIATLSLEKNIRNKDILNRYMMPYLSSYSKEETKIVYTLLEYLEQNGDISSVGILFSKDSDKLIYGNVSNALTNLTDYEILSKVSLEEHTLRVVQKMFWFAHENKLRLEIYAPKLLIIALAHDIGKIENSKISNEEIQDASVAKNKKVIFQKNTHEHLSTLIMKAMFLDYISINTICEAIDTHHIKLEKNKHSHGADLRTVLIQADRAAREEELLNYFKLIKNNDNKQEAEEQQIEQNVNEEQADSIIVKKNPLLTKKDGETILRIVKPVINQQQEEIQNQVENEHEEVKDEKDNEQNLIEELRKNVIVVIETDSGRLHVKSILDSSNQYFLFDCSFFNEIFTEIIGKKKGSNQIQKSFLKKYNIVQEKVMLKSNTNTMFFKENSNSYYLIPITTLSFDKDQAISLKNEDDVLNSINAVVQNRLI